MHYYASMYMLGFPQLEGFESTGTCLNVSLAAKDLQCALVLAWHKVDRYALGLIFEWGEVAHEEVAHHLHIKFSCVGA